MPLKLHTDLIQGSEEWLAARCGLLTASKMKLIITPANLKPANNDKERQHLYELLAQRITKRVEPHYQGEHMLRGIEDELEAKRIYNEKKAKTTDVGFITNDKFGFTLGCSPDALVGDDGVIECKSRLQKYQLQTIIDGEMPDDYTIQVQTILLISERKWCDFVSYCGGMPMLTLRVYPDRAVQDAIKEAAEVFHKKMDEKLAIYNARLQSPMSLIPTERRATEMTAGDYQ